MFAAKKLQGAGGVGGLPSDPDFNSVSFLSHFDGANNGVNNVFDDGSASNHTINVNAGQASLNGAAQGSFSPFTVATGEPYDPAVNGASSYFILDGNYLSVPNSADFDLGGTFTIDLWMYKTTTDDGTIVGRWYAGDASAWLLHSWFGKLAFGTGLGTYPNATTNLIPVGSWVHLAVCMDSSGKRLYINGVLDGSHAQDVITSGSTNNVTIPANTGGGLIVSGYYSDVRIIKGTALYTGSTYTLPTAPATAITNTKLLLNMANGQAIDSAAKNDLTLIGNAKISSTQSKFGGTSMYFLNTTDSVSMPTPSSLKFQGDFTIEAWVNTPNATNNAYSILYANYGAYTTTDSMYIALSNASNGKITLYVLGVSIVAATATPNNQWIHIAAVRYGSTIQLFVDGVSQGTATASGSINGDTGNTYIGRAGGYDQGMVGYVDDFRITNGVARYTSNFTPPSAAFPDIGE